MALAFRCFRLGWMGVVGRSIQFSHCFGLLLHELSELLFGVDEGGRVLA